LQLTIALAAEAWSPASHWNVKLCSKW